MFQKFYNSILLFFATSKETNIVRDCRRRRRRRRDREGSRCCGNQSYLELQGVVAGVQSCCSLSRPTSSWDNYLICLLCPPPLPPPGDTSRDTELQSWLWFYNFIIRLYCSLQLWSIVAFNGRNENNRSLEFHTMQDDGVFRGLYKFS